MSKIDTLEFVPALDLKQQHESLASEIDDAMQGVLSQTSFILGPQVKAFEERIANFVGCAYAIGLASGTDALRLAFAALEIGSGDEVITTPFSFIATANTITRAGATPVFVDIDPVTFNLDVSKLESALTSKTRAIVPVHLYGQPCNMEEILRFCRAHNLWIIEDCAQAIGSSWDGHQVGTFGHLGCFSFYPTKNLGAYGDAGMVTCTDPALAEKLDLLRRHGCEQKYVADRLGFNSRLDALQAAILGVKLNYLDSWNERRRRLAASYNSLLASLPQVTPPAEDPAAHAVYHQYTIRAERRDELKNFLQESGIGSMIYYPVPMHLQPLYSELGYGEGSLPEAERASREVLSLPMFPELSEGQQDRVAAAIADFYS